MAKNSDPQGAGVYRPEDADLDALLRPVVHAIRRAPSRSNCQPWKLRSGDGLALEIGIDEERRLRARDPRGIYTFAGIGCAVEAANAVAKVQWTPVDDLQLMGTGVVGTLTVDELRKHYLTQKGLIGIRHTSRRAFDAGTIAKELGQIIQAVPESCTAQVHVIDDRRLVALVAQLTYEATARNLRDATWIFDAVRWLRGSKREFDWDETGVPIPALGVEAWLSIFARAGKRLPILFDRLRSPKTVSFLAKQTQDLMCASGGLVLITGEDDHLMSAVDAGRTLMAVWLAATSQGLSVHPVSTPAELEDSRSELLDAFQCATSRHPLCVVRLGRPIGAEKFRTTPRLPLTRILATSGIGLDQE
jgi:nitroreductase